MKKIVLGLCIGATLGLCGCSLPKDYSVQAVQQKHSTDYFEEILIDTYNNVTILRDKYTNVLYIKYHSGYKGGLTVMLNTDGTPMLYNEWLEIQNKR